MKTTSPIFFSFDEEDAQILAIDIESCCLFKVDERKIVPINVPKSSPKSLPAFAQLLVNHLNETPLSIQEAIESQGVITKTGTPRTFGNIKTFFTHLKTGFHEKDYLKNKKKQIVHTCVISGFKVADLKILTPEEVADLNLIFPQPEETAGSQQDEEILSPSSYDGGHQPNKPSEGKPVSSQNDEEVKSEAPFHHNVPVLPSYYVKPKEFKSLRRKLLDRPKHPVGTLGMPGVGKTVLGIAVARDDKIQKSFPDGVYYLRLQEHSNPSASQRIFATIAGCKNPPEFQDILEGINFLRPRFEHRKCLLVLDNVWSKKILSAFNIFGKEGQLLFTTRLGHLFESPDEIHKITTPEPDDALKVLEKTSGVKPLPSSAKAIAQECGYLPLALTMIGCSLIQVRDEELWNYKLDCLRNADIKEIDSEVRDYPYQSFLPAMQVSFDELNQETKDCFLSLVIFPDNEPVPEGVIGIYWSHSKKSVNWRVTLQELEQKSLLLRRENGLMLHDLVRDYCRFKVKNEIPNLHADFITASQIEHTENWKKIFRQSDYFFQWISFHLIAAGKHERLRELLLNYSWIALKYSKTGIYRVLEDYRRYRRYTFQAHTNRGKFKKNVQKYKWVLNKVKMYTLLNWGAEFYDLDVDIEVGNIERCLNLSAHILATRDELPSRLHGHLDRGTRAQLSHAIVEMDSSIRSGQDDYLIIRVILCFFKLFRAFRNIINKPDKTEPFLLKAYRSGYWFRPLFASLSSHRGSVVRTIPLQHGKITAVTFGKNRQQAYMATKDQVIIQYSLETDQVIETFSLPNLLVKNISLSQVGRHALIGSEGGHTEILNLETSQSWQIKLHRERPKILAAKYLSPYWYLLFPNDLYWGIDNDGFRKFGLVFFPEQVKLADIGEANGLVTLNCTHDNHIWFSGTKNNLELPFLDTEVTAISLEEHAKYACIGFRTGEFRVWSFDDKKIVLENKIGCCPVTACSVSSTFVFIGDENGCLHIWNLGRAKNILTKKCFPGKILRIVHRSRESIIVSDGRSVIEVNPTSSMKAIPMTHLSRLGDCLAVGKGHVLIGNEMGEVKGFKVSENEEDQYCYSPTPSFTFNLDEFLSLSWGTRDDHIIGLSGDGLLSQWDVTKFPTSSETTFEASKLSAISEVIGLGEWSEFYGVSITPTQDILALCSNKNFFLQTVKTDWGLTVENDDELVPAFALDPGKKQILAVSKGGDLKIYSARIRKGLKRIGHKTAIHEIHQFPGSSLIVSTSEKGSDVKEWNICTGELKKIYFGPKGLAYRLFLIHSLFSSGIFVSSKFVIWRGSPYQVENRRSGRKSKVALRKTGPYFTFFPCGNFLVFGVDQNLFFHNISSGKQRSVRIPEGDIKAVQPVLSDHHLAVGTTSGLYLFRDHGEHQEHFYPDIEFCYWSSDNLWDTTENYFILVSTGEITICDMKTNAVSKSPLSISNPKAIVVDNLCQTVYLGASDGHMYAWDIQTKSAEDFSSSSSTPIIKLSYSDKQKMVYALTSETLTVWDCVSRKKLTSFSGDFPFTTFAQSDCGRHVAIGDEDGRLHFLKLENGRWYAKGK